MTEALTRLAIGCLVAAPFLLAGRIVIDLGFDVVETLRDEHRRRIEDLPVSRHQGPGGGGVSDLYPVVVRDVEDAGYTLEQWCRLWFDVPAWGGDACGCTDDRCIGYHHEEHEDCGCFPVLLKEATTRW